MKTFGAWCVVLVLIVATVGPSQAFNEDRVLVREKRTVQALLSHFAQWFGLSNPAKAADKQDSGAPSWTAMLMASTGSLSGSSSGSRKHAPTPKPFSAEFEIPRSPERLTQPGPSKLPLLDSEAPAPSEAPPSEEPASEPPLPASTEETPTEAPEEHPPTTEPIPSEPEPDSTTVDPVAVNTLAGDDDAQKRDDNSTQIDGNPTQFNPITTNYIGQQQPQQFRRPPWNPFGSTTYSSPALPYTTYFGNNVFLPAPFVPQPFSHFGQYQQIPHYQQAAHSNLATAASSSSHSRVKMHDHPYDLVTFHGDSNGAGSTSYYDVRKRSNE